jgi:hypothetical protein
VRELIFNFYYINTIKFLSLLGYHSPFSTLLVHGLELKEVRKMVFEKE